MSGLSLQFAVQFCCLASPLAQDLSGMNTKRKTLDLNIKPEFLRYSSVQLAWVYM